MKQQLKKIIHDLKLSMSFPPCEMLDQQIDDFFKRIQGLDPDVVFDENKSDDGHLRHRQVVFQSPEEGIYIDVKVVQAIHLEISIAPLYVIDADFGDED